MVNVGTYSNMVLLIIIVYSDMEGTILLVAEHTSFDSKLLYYFLSNYIEVDKLIITTHTDFSLFNLISIKRTRTYVSGDRHKHIIILCICILYAYR